MAMKIPINSRRNYIFGVIIFIALFALLSQWYVKRHRLHNKEQFSQHATVITPDLWALNQAAVKSYLQLAVLANHYKYLLVKLDQDEIFLRVSAPPLSLLDTMLHAAGLLPLKHLSIPTTYHGHYLGTLQGEQYCTEIYPLLNLFIFLQLLLFITLYVLNLSGNRRQLEQEVQERTKKYRNSEQRFHDLINLLPEIVYETDAEGYLTYVNKIALKKFGFSGSEMQGKSSFDLIVDKQRKRARNNFTILLQGQELPLQETTAQKADGDTFPVLVRSAPIYDGLVVCGSRSIIIDITDRSALEEKLRNAQRMEVIGLMASGVAHDLNNILSGMINYPEILLQQLPPDSPFRPQVRAIKKSGCRAAEVVTDLLTVARGAAVTKMIANPNTIIREYLDSPEFTQLQSRYTGITWNINLDENVTNILCSESHVKKSIMNLVVNASEAIAGSGEITLTTSSRIQQEGGDNDLTKNWVVMSVSDTGPGISKKDQEHIFEPFYTRKVMGKSGTGLGLTVVWNTMQDHEGDVLLQSDNYGTTFSLFFPASEQEMAPYFKEIQQNLEQGNGEKILVVDDDPQQQDIALQLLNTLNYKVSVVSSGEQAVEYLRTRAVHLLLLDMLMPPGMNGMQTYKQILAIHPRQKAIIVSGFSDSKEVQETLTLGAAAFLKKPYGMKQLAMVVHAVLNSKVP